VVRYAMDQLNPMDFQLFLPVDALSRDEAPAGPGGRRRQLHPDSGGAKRNAGSACDPCGDPQGPDAAQPIVDVSQWRLQRNGESTPQASPSRPSRLTRFGRWLRPRAGLDKNGKALRDVRVVVQETKDANAATRQLALMELCDYGQAALRKHASSLVVALADPDEAVRQVAVVLFGKFERGLLRHHAGSIVRLLDDGSVGVRAAVVGVICKHPSVLLNFKNERLDTPLHLAAKSGHLSICQRLVCAGALVNVKNKDRLMPIDLARGGEHTDVVDFLGTRLNPFTIVGGTGDAVAIALADDRPVIRVEWYTIPLPRFYGSIGAKHSLLAIMVGDSEESARTYVIEKAATIRAVHGENDAVQQIKNGVHVSHWLDVAPIIGDSPIYCLDHSDINHGIRMHELWEMCVNLGPYEVATCNCHHAALVVYNACAREAAQVTEIPNATLVSIVSWVPFVGMASIGSGPSTALGSAASVGTSAVSNGSTCHFGVSAGTSVASFGKAIDASQSKSVESLESVPTAQLAHCPAAGEDAEAAVKGDSDATGGAGREPLLCEEREELRRRGSKRFSSLCAWPTPSAVSGRLVASICSR